MRIDVDWIGFRVSDALGDPVPNAELEVILPDSSRRVVYTNDQGIANLPSIPSGQCRVTVMGTYGEAWELG